MKGGITSLVPIYIFSIIIGLFGASQILNADNMAATVPSFFPAPKVFIYITGAALILAAIAFIIDRMAKPAGYLLALLLLLIVFSVDVPGILHAGSLAEKAIFSTNALKDAAMAMAALVIGNLSKH